MHLWSYVCTGKCQTTLVTLLVQIFKNDLCSVNHFTTPPHLVAITIWLAYLYYTKLVTCLSVLWPCDASYLHLLSSRWLWSAPTVQVVRGASALLLWLMNWWQLLRKIHHVGHGGITFWMRYTSNCDAVLCWLGLGFSFLCWEFYSF